MTGYDIYKRALSELCLEKTAEDTEKSLPSAAINCINDIGSDLYGSFHIKNVFDTVPVPESDLAAFTYGVAMLLAALYGLDGKNAFFSELYNLKRSIVKSSSGKIKNTIPAV